MLSFFALQMTYYKSTPFVTPTNITIKAVFTALIKIFEFNISLRLLRLVRSKKCYAKGFNFKSVCKNTLNYNSCGKFTTDILPE